MAHFCVYLLRARSGCLGALLRVPRPAASSFTYAEHPGSPIPATWYSSAKNKVSTSQRQGGGARQSEVKEEAAGRGTRTAAGASTLPRAQQKRCPCHTGENLVLY